MTKNKDKNRRAANKSAIKRTPLEIKNCNQMQRSDIE